MSKYYSIYTRNLLLSQFHLFEIKVQILIIKVTANVIAISLFRTFRPSAGVITSEQLKLHKPHSSND